MTIDLAALAKAADGDQARKVTVTKAWLAEVHRELVELQARRDRSHLSDRIADIGEKLMGMAGPR
jgi:hypothetical protein